MLTVDFARFAGVAEHFTSHGTVYIDFMELGIDLPVVLDLDLMIWSSWIQMSKTAACLNWQQERNVWQMPPWLTIWYRVKFADFYKVLRTLTTDVWNTAAILSRPQCVRLGWLSTISYNFLGQMTSSKAADKIARNHVLLPQLIKTAAWFSYSTGQLVANLRELFVTLVDSSLKKFYTCSFLRNKWMFV